MAVTRKNTSVTCIRSGTFSAVWARGIFHIWSAILPDSSEILWLIQEYTGLYTPLFMQLPGFPEQSEE